MEGWGLFGVAGYRPQHKIHVLTKKEELDSVRVPGKVVVVLDIMFATTTMVAALAHGANEIVPVLDESGGARPRQGFPGALLCSPASCTPRRFPGFAHPAPLALVDHGVRGQDA